MKALEKAAKDRGETKATKPAATAPPTELSLEPLAAATPHPQTETSASHAAAPEPTASLQARAASVIHAGRRDNAGMVTYLREHPLALAGAAAAIFLAGFGVYVYLQIASPALFVRRTPPALATAPAAPSPAESAAMATAPAPPAPTPAPSRPLATTTVIGADASASPPPQQPATSPPKTAPATPGPPAEPPRHTIAVSRGSTLATVPPLLAEAYAALESRNLDEARRLYRQLLLGEPRNVDALLGLAAIAMQTGDTEEAARHYLRVLELDPRHALAQSGLIAIFGRADPLAAETRLKQLIARDPSPFLYFTLGNLYADQSLWAQAQQAYFQAHHLDPANPDYAYNLAVGLEHLGQSRLALGFYRRAMELAAAKGHAHFSLPQAQERAARLASRVE